MSKFCMKCGAQLPDEAKFCAMCGTQQPSTITSSETEIVDTTPVIINDQAEEDKPDIIPSEEVITSTPVTVNTEVETKEPTVIQSTPAEVVTIESIPIEASKKPKKKSAALLFAIIFLLIIIIAGILVFIFVDKPENEDYKEPVSSFVAGLEDSDWDDFSDAFTDEVVDDFNKTFDTLGYDDGDDYIECIYDKLENEYGDDLKISINYVDKAKYHDKDIDDLEDDYKKNHDKKIRISNAYNIECEFIFKGEDKEDKNAVELTIIEVDSDWYILNNDFLMF